MRISGGLPAMLLIPFISFFAPSAWASSSDWQDSGFIDANWTSPNNWNSGVPGAVGTAVSNADTAFFKFSHNLMVNVDSTRSIASVVFDTSFAGAFTLQGGGLYVTFGGAIWVKNTVQHAEVVNSAIFLPSTANAIYSFISDSTSSGASLSIGGAVTGRQLANNTGTLSLDGAGNGVVTGVISDGTAGGKVALSKDHMLPGAGSGTWTIFGNNSYTGTTTVNAGKLLINGDQTRATGAVSVNNSGSVLGGTGIIGGAVTVNGGASITGASSGSVGTLTLASSATFSGPSGSSLATFAVDLLGASSDRLTISGALNLNSSFDRILFNGNVNGTTTYVLATYSSVIGTFDNVTNLPAGYRLIYGANEIELAPVPEPSTWIAASLTLLTIVFRGGTFPFASILRRQPRCRPPRRERERV